MKIHTIKHGETISSIAKHYSISKEDLLQANSISSPNSIFEGKSLTIPEKRNKAASKAPIPPLAASKKPVKTEVRSIFDQWGDTWRRETKVTTTWLEGLLQKLRTIEANEHVQNETSGELSKDQKATQHAQVKPEKNGSLSPRKLSDVKSNLKNSLGKEPHVIAFNGVKLTNNEKKQIVASVAICEMNKDGFGSVNSDQEFVGRKYGAKGIGGLTYSRILHIGLSYGVIQYTQDSGSLGKVLAKMEEKNPSKFFEFFGGGDEIIARNLLALTGDGRPDLLSNAAVPPSGQAYWDSIRKTPTGQELSALANGPTKSELPVSREIRGKRVQPIPASTGAAPTDLWTGIWRERFIAAGSVLDFQEAQLEFAVANFFDPILPLAKTNKVRSALALGFVAACAIRGGPGSKLSRLLYRVAAAKNIPLPFQSSEDERKCIDAIAEANGTIGDIHVDADETRRAKLLIKDELGFLSEDLYDLSTY